MKKDIFNFSNTYCKLPNNFFEEIKPKPVKDPQLIEFNKKLATFLNIDPKKINNENGSLYFSGNSLPKGSNPIATAYAGHQFGNYVPQLGDGRAVLIGELIGSNGKRFDLQLKGSGRTSFSRQGDGRSPLGPVIREYILSESLHYLGVKSTRSLAIVKTGEDVFREQQIPGGILTRVASSHIRIGTFEYFFYKNDFKSLQKLADYTIKRHFKRTFKDPYKSLLQNVVKLQAKLVSKWMGVGFIHGVMNTDNTSISGETIDYGPCAFMDNYIPNKVFSSIDYGGRYSYINQGKIMLWNLSKFAECLIPLLNKNFDKSKTIAIDCLKLFPISFEEKWLGEMRKKIGLRKKLREDIRIINDLFDLLKNEKLDFTETFRQLPYFLEKNDNNDFTKKLNNKVKFYDWIKQWKLRIKRENIKIEQIISELKKTNPIYIPRNHIVEQVINSAVNNDNFMPMRELLKVIKNPFTEISSKKKYSTPPKPNEVISNTFCGT